MTATTEPLRRRPEQLPCGGVSIYVKKGLYNKPIQLGTHLQAVAVQVTLGGSPVTILSVYTPSSDHLTTQDLSRLIRGLNGQILIIRDLNGHSYSWGNLNNDTRGDVIERFTDRNNLCILNDGSPTYMEPQAQHSQNSTSAIDLSICTPGLALKCSWEVLPDTHGNDHYLILISMPPTSRDTNQGGDPSHWVFSKADWEQFVELCMDKIMINTGLVWYLEKYGILDKSQCGFRKHRSTTDHLVSLERYVRDAFAQKQQAVGLFFDLEKAYETTWQYGIIRDLHKIGLRGRLPVFMSEYLRDRRIRVRIGNTLSDEYYTEEGVPPGGVLAVTWFGLKINELPSIIAMGIFRALFVDDLAICFRGRSLDTIERHLQQAVNAIQEWATRNGFRFAAHKCKVVHFTAPRYKAPRPPTIRISDTLLPVEESTKFLGLWWDSHLSFKEHISALKTQCKEALNLIRVVAHLKWGGDRDTLLMLYRTIVRSKLDYGCIVYGTASNTNLRQLDSIHNAGLRLALRAFCTSPVSSMYTEANEAPLEERRLKLSMNYYLKTRACTSCTTWIWPNHKRSVSS